jgi:hypothetical protein
MPLKINVSLAVAGLTFAIEASSVDEMTDAIQQLHSVLDQKTGVGQASTPAPTPSETGKAKKSASTDKPAASSPPADSTKADSAASAPTPASSSPAAAPAAAEVTYEKSGIPEKIAGYLGAKESGGYAERRAAMVALLTEFKVKTGKDLTAAQFADFDAALTKLATPAEEDLG